MLKPTKQPKIVKDETEMRAQGRSSWHDSFRKIKKRPHARLREKDMKRSNTNRTITQRMNAPVLVSQERRALLRADKERILSHSSDKRKSLKKEE